MKVFSILTKVFIVLSTLALDTTSHPTSNPLDLEAQQPQLENKPTELITFQKPRRRHLIYDPRTHASALQKRWIVENAIDHLNDDWVGWFIWVSEFLPIPQASSALYDIYDRIFSQALLTWVDDEAPQNFVTMTVGFVQLTMKGDNGAVIPWVFVQTFAAKLKHATSMGFRGSYTAYYTNPQAQLGVSITLTTLAMVAGAA